MAGARPPVRERRAWRTTEARWPARAGRHLPTRRVRAAPGAACRRAPVRALGTGSSSRWDAAAACRSPSAGWTASPAAAKADADVVFAMAAVSRVPGVGFKSAARSRAHTRGKARSRSCKPRINRPASSSRLDGRTRRRRGTAMTAAAGCTIHGRGGWQGDAAAAASVGRRGTLAFDPAAEARRPGRQRAGAVVRGGAMPARSRLPDSAPGLNTPGRTETAPERRSGLGTSGPKGVAAGQAAMRVPFHTLQGRQSGMRPEDPPGIVAIQRLSERAPARPAVDPAWMAYPPSAGSAVR